MDSIDSLKKKFYEKGANQAIRENEDADFVKNLAASVKCVRL